MLAWKRSFLARLGMGFRLIWRTALLQLVLGLMAAAVMGLIGFSMRGVAMGGGAISSVAIASVGVLLSLLLQVVAGVVFVGGMLLATEKPGQVPVRLALALGWRRWPVAANSALLLTLLATVALGLVGALTAMLQQPALLLLALPLLWLGLRLATLPMVTIIEDVTPLAAIRRAWRISQGFCWPMLGNGLLLALLAVVVVVAILFLLGGTGIAALASALASGHAPSMMSALMTAGAMGVGILLVIVVDLLAMQLVTALIVLFYREQCWEQGEQGALPTAGAVPPVAQKVIAWGWMGLIALVPVAGYLFGGQLGGGMVMPPRATTPPPRAMARHPRPPAAPARPAVRKPAASKMTLAQQKVAIFQALRHGNLARAEQRFGPLLRQHPEDGWLLQAEGWLLYRGGKRAQAVKVMAHACRRGVMEACLLAKEGEHAQ